MNLSSPITTLFFPPAVTARDTLSASSVQPDTSEHHRTRRDTSTATASRQVIPDEEVPAVFQAKVTQAKYGADADVYLKGYKAPTSVKLPDYSASMSQLALMRLALDNTLDPDQMGALQYWSEHRVMRAAGNNVAAYTSIMTKVGVTTTGNPQSYYLAIVNQLAGGECAGFSHLHSLAVAEGKEHIFLGNIFQATVDPDTPESQAFFQTLAKVQGKLKNRGIAHDPATVKVAPFTSIAPLLKDSPTTKTLLISSEGHRLTAGVIVGPGNTRTYYYTDPNIGPTKFASAELFEEGLRKVFTDRRLQHLTQPLQGYSDGPKYLISVFNRNHIPEVSGDTNNIKFMYDAPLYGLDKVKVINASRLPTAEDIRQQAPAPDSAASKQYNQVLQGLDDVQAGKGMAQYHKALAVLDSVKYFMADHPNSMLMSVMKTLAQKLVNVINEAEAPVDFPFIFERMEADRAKLAEQAIGSPTQFRTERIQGKSVDIKNNSSAHPSRTKAVTDAVDAALKKLLQRDPAAAEAVGEKIRVVIANPGDQAETQLRLGEPPVLVIGDDFFAAPTTADSTVADRIGREAQADGGDPSTQKQAALIAGKLGMVSYYKNHSKAFLEMLNNPEPFRGVGSHLSPRASRSSADFMTQAFTARLYDGALNNQIETSIRKILPLPDVPQVPVTVTPPAASGVTIDPDQVKRLKLLDDTQPALRIGEVEVSRVELYKMGATLNGKPIESALANDPQGRTLANTLQIDYVHFAAYRRAASEDVTGRITDVVEALAANRSSAVAPLISRADGGLVPETLQKPIREITQHADELRALESSGKPLPEDFFASEAPGKVGATTAAGLGMRAFSTYHQLRSGIQNLEGGDTTAGVINLGSVVADFAGDGAEYAMNRAAQKIISSQAPSIAGFKTGSLGKMIGKAGGGVGSLLSVPFDIYTAIDSFTKATKTTGKEAQDHYVNGTMAVAGAVTSIALSASFMTRGGASSRVGMAVAATLMSAQAIYTAVRGVEDIDGVTPLTGPQKFSSGLKFFLGIEPGFDVMKPYLEANYSKANDENNRTRFENFLKGPGKEFFERVVIGSTDVEVKRVPGSVALTPSLWYSPITWLLNLIPAPGLVPQVSAKGGKDHISSDLTSWNQKPVNTVEGEQGQNKATYWDLGDGSDWVEGIKQKPNYFVMGGGKKGIKGGDADDKFVFNADARQAREQASEVEQAPNQDSNAHASVLDGGRGRNALIFSGPLTTTFKENGQDTTTKYLGHHINLQTNTVSIRTPTRLKDRDYKVDTDGLKKIAHIQAFSDVTTVAQGQSVIQGDDQNNLFTLNGKIDRVFTGKGANFVVINGGAEVVGEGGANTYLLNKASQANSSVIIEDPADSIVRLDYSAAQVSDWTLLPSGDLIVTLTGDTPDQSRILVIKKALPNDSPDDKARPTFITNDGVMMTISAPRQADSSNRVVQVHSMKVEVTPKA